jgi:head-tail adaptor
MSAGLDAATLAELTAVDLSFMDKTATIQSPTATDDGAGGTSTSWTTTATVPCRIGPLNQAYAELVVDALQTTQSFWTIDLPAGTDVGMHQRILVDGRTFAVVRSMAGSFETSRSYICKETT